jgi:DNA repair protein RadC
MQLFSRLFDRLTRKTVSGSLFLHRNWIFARYKSVYPREVVLRAVHHHAAAVVLARNHPSGSVHPSPADLALTQTLRAALALLDVRVRDHIIVGPGAALSMAEKGLL